MDQRQPQASIARGGAIIGMILTFVGGYFVGHYTSAPGADDDPGARAARVERAQVPIGLSPALGAADAMVTVVEFADFQCGFCARSLPLQKRLLAERGSRVRWVFKHFPIEGHTHAEDAARASLAAHAQGRFWEYHDRLFGNQRNLAAPYFETLARELGLDVARFRVALQGDALARLVREDRALGSSLGVRGTPSFFVNGRKVVGTMSYAELDRVVTEELALAAKLLKEGVAREQLYDRIARPRPAAPASQPASQPVRTTGSDAPSPRGQPQKLAAAPAKEGELYQVRPGASPALGAADALVTVVAYADFECEKSAQVMASLRALRSEYGERLRIVYKHFPLARHAHARLAARASLAAHAQGKFWPFAERLFANQKDLAPERLLAHARAVGLDAERLQAELASERHERAVARDEDEAVRFGSIGTPSLFVNGRHVRGAAELDELRRIVEQEHKRATAALREGVAREQLYERLIARGAPRA